MKKYLIILLLMASVSSSSFAIMADMSPRKVKSAVLQNLYDFSSMLEVTDHYLVDYQKVLTEARGILVKGTDNKWNAKDRDEMIVQLILHADELKKIVQYAQFNSKPLFFQSNDPYQKQVWVVLNENSKAQLFEINNPLFRNEKMTLQDIYSLRPSQESFNTGLFAIDEALSRLRVVRNEIKAYQLRMDNLILLQKSLLDDTASLDKKMNSYVVKLEEQMYELSIRACNGIFTDEDRLLLNTRFQEFKLELIRVQKLKGIKHHFSYMRSANILKREDAEKVMLSFKP